MALESKGFAGGGELSGANPVGRFLGRVSGQPFMQNVIPTVSLLATNRAAPTIRVPVRIPV